MCACSATFTCSKCAGTPFDPRYEDDAYEPMDLDEFDKLTEGTGRMVWDGWL